jgi:hypothetical protein
MKCEKKLKSIVLLAPNAIVTAPDTIYKPALGAVKSPLRLNAPCVSVTISDIGNFITVLCVIVLPASLNA